MCAPRLLRPCCRAPASRTPAIAMNCARLLALAAAALLLAGAALAADECLKAEPNCAPGKCNPDAPEFCDQCKLDWVFGDDGLVRVCAVLPRDRHQRAVRDPPAR